MEEGGIELDNLGLDKTEDNDEDNDEDVDNNIITTTSTSTFPNPAFDDEEQETSFNEKSPLLVNKNKELESAEEVIKKVRPRAKLKQFLSFFQRTRSGIELPAIEGPSGGIYVYTGNDEFRRYDKKTGEIKEKLKPGKLKTDLGPSRGEIVEQLNSEIVKKKEKQNERLERKKALDNKPNKTQEETTELENVNTEIINNDEDIANDIAERERIQETISLRERIKEIFKKHGFTVFAILSAVGVVIGVIVSNLSKGLSALGRGVGNGLKTIGKKLGEILPGMVGAIVSFLFKTAGEAIGFLGKNAWLFIMAVVLYFVESIKKKRK